MRRADASGLSRRTLVKGAAWAMPAIVLATAVPRAAASTTVCTPGPVTAVPVAQWTIAGALATWDAGNTGWLPIGSDPGHAQSSWIAGITNDDGFLASADNANTTETVLTATYSFPVTPGASYSIDVLTSTGAASGAQRASQWVQVLAQAGSTTGVIAQVATSSPTVGVAPPSGYILQNSWDAQKVTRTGVFTAGSDASVGTITYRFTLPGLPTPRPGAYEPGDVNDDMWVSAPVVTLTACPVN